MLTHQIQCLVDKLEHPNSTQTPDTQVLRNAISYIEKLEKVLKLYEEERTRFRHTKPELTGAFFISGESGYKDTNQLPDYVHICPAYGCDWSQVYQKTTRTTK